jgi:peptidoglycan/xylan/chitin deacetylase (PgdA/CDA1 family)
MRAAIGRGIAAVTIAVCGYAVIVTSDAPVQPGSAPALPAQSAGPDDFGRASRSVLSARESVVPFGRTTLELPILMYHYIRVPPSPRRDLVGFNLSVAPAVFAQQMDWLEAHGYHTVTFEDLRRYWRRQEPLPARPVIVTIDDGYQDLYTTAYPILAAHGFTAVAYIVTGFVGENGYVTADEVLDLARHGIEIGAHTVNHSDLARAQQPWLTYQVVESRAWLEKLLGAPVVDMAYPSGKYDAAAIQAVERAGYWSAVTEQLSLLHTQADRFEWGRVRVAGGESLALFVTNLGPTMPTVAITHVVPASTAIDLHHLA